MRKDYVLTAQVPNIALLTAVANGDVLCKCKHHTSVCEKHSDETSELMLASTESSVIYPVTIIKVNGIKCPALLGTGSGSSYASEAIHCVKSVQIRSYFWSVFSCIQSKYRKIGTINNSVFGHFSRSDY